MHLNSNNILIKGTINNSKKVENVIKYKSNKV